MKAILRLFLMLSSAVFFYGPRGFAKSVRVEGEISNVIVYRGQALVSREIEVELGAGSHEIIVENLANEIIPQSIYALGDKEMDVLSVRYRMTAVREDTRSEVKELDGQIEGVSAEMRITERNLQNTVGIYRKYEELWKLNIQGANVDIDRGVLDAGPVEKLSGYLEGKLVELHDKTVGLEEKKRELEHELNHLKRKRENLAKGHSRQKREALVYVLKDRGGKSRIELNYLVNNANWEPQYNLRAKLDDNVSVIEYNAVVHQSSGEDWEEAKISLSTAEPSMVAGSPDLDPMKISLREIQVKYDQVQVQRSLTAREMEDNKAGNLRYEEYVDLTDEFSRLQKERRKQVSLGKKAEATLNSFAFRNQLLELAADNRAMQKMKGRAILIQRTEGVSVMYQLDGKLSLPSRSDQQLLNIATVEVPASFVHTATPLLTDYVYLEGTMVNDSETIMLPGPASMYRNGEFVGKGSMELVAVGQKFVTGFGIDPQVKVLREFKDKKIESLWGNRIDDQEYRIEVSNYRDEPVSLKLYERIPYSENPDISIELSKMSHELSDDSDYIRTQKDKGILRWDVVVEGKSTHESAMVVEYGYRMKYDNDMRIEAVDK